MAVEKSYARLGLFLVIAIVVILATALVFIQRMRSREVIELVTYTQENVTGLDISSPVRYRGVAVGRVSNLQVEPGGRTIEIDFELFTDRLTTVGANVTNLQDLARSPAFFERLRAQVVGNPVTGEAYLFLDMPENPPPPMTLGFTPSRPYIPSMPTPISELRDRLPEVLERVESTLQVLREIVARMPDSLDRADRFFTNVERIVRESELPALSADSRKFFSTTTAQIEAIASNLDGLVGDEGTLSKFADEARAAIDAADLPGLRPRHARSDGPGQPGGGGPAALAARDARVARAAARARAPAAGTAGVGGPRHPAGRSEAEMIRRSRYGMLFVLAVACLGGGCRVRIERPDTVPIRMIEPRLVEPEGVAADAPNATSVRLLETQSRAHIGRRVLHQQPGGEVTEDPVWLWASTPDRYLDSAVRYAIGSSPDIRLVDVGSAPSLAVTLVVWQIEAAPSPRLVGAVEVQVTTTDRAVHSEIIRAEEPIAADLPGDLAAAAGRLLGRLATDCLSRVIHQGS